MSFDSSSGAQYFCHSCQSGGQTPCNGSHNSALLELNVCGINAAHEHQTWQPVRSLASAGASFGVLGACIVLAKRIGPCELTNYSSIDKSQHVALQH